MFPVSEVTPRSWMATPELGLLLLVLVIVKPATLPWIRSSAFLAPPWLKSSAYTDVTAEVSSRRF